MTTTNKVRFWTCYILCCLPLMLCVHWCWYSPFLLPGDTLISLCQQIHLKHHKKEHTCTPSYIYIYMANVCFIYLNYCI